MPDSEATHSGPGVSLDVIDSTGGAPVRSPIASWDDAESLSLDVSSGSHTSRFRRACPMPQDHEIRICAYPYRFAGDGRTTLLTEGDPGEGHAVSAVVRVDTSGGCCSKRDMRALLCHEVGHAFGLDHRSVKSRSCMADPITSAQPDDRDIATLDRIYGGPGEPEAQSPLPALPL
ncbi:MAG: hypothetical protein M3456_13265 [Actinomycetota bacterium]|nr:hypothetical protein [Actinomycetota bacterium]